MEPHRKKKFCPAYRLRSEILNDIRYPQVQFFHSRQYITISIKCWRELHAKYHLLPRKVKQACRLVGIATVGHVLFNRINQRSTRQRETAQINKADVFPMLSEKIALRLSFSAGKASLRIGFVLLFLYTHKQGKAITFYYRFTGYFNVIHILRNFKVQLM